MHSRKYNVGKRSVKHFFFDVLHVLIFEFRLDTQDKSRHKKIHHATDS